MLSAEVPTRGEHWLGHRFPVFGPGFGRGVRVSAEEVLIPDPGCPRNFEVLSRQVFLENSRQPFHDEILQLALGHFLGLVGIVSEAEGHQGWDAGHDLQI